MRLPARFWRCGQTPHTLSTILNPRDASGRLSRLMAAIEERHARKARFVERLGGLQ